MRLLVALAVALLALLVAASAVAALPPNPMPALGRPDAAAWMTVSGLRHYCRTWYYSDGFVTTCQRPRPPRGAS